MKPFKDEDPHWNRCDICGRFISLEDFDSGKANRRMVTPDTDFTCEDYETLCRDHYKPALGRTLYPLTPNAVIKGP